MGAFGKGKGYATKGKGYATKGKAYTGKSKGYSSTNDWATSADSWGEQWDDHAAETSSTTTPQGHIKAMYRLPKKILSPYAGAGGSCLYGDTPDDQKLDRKQFRDLLAPGNTEWQRPARLAYAMSEFPSSMESLMDTLEELGFKDIPTNATHNMGATKLHDLFATSGQDFKEAVEFINFADAKEAKTKLGAPGA